MIGPTGPQQLFETYLNITSGSGIVKDTPLTNIQVNNAYTLAAASAPGGEWKYVVNTATNSTFKALSTGGVPTNNRSQACAYDEINGMAFFGGTYTSIGGVANTANVAKWSTATKQWLSVGIFNGGVYTLAENPSTGAVVAGGFFNVIDGVSILRVAQYQNNTWSGLGTGANGVEWSCCFDENTGDLYIGGGFSSPGNDVARWDGSAWNALGSGTGSGEIRAVAFDSLNNLLYVGGTFTNIGGVAVDRIAVWDGATWAAIGGLSGADGTVFALAARNGVVVIGGDFTTIGGSSINRVATWTGGPSYNSLSTGKTTAVESLSISSTNIIACGGFNGSHGGTTSSSLALWNGSNWVPALPAPNNDCNGIWYDNRDRLWVATAGSTAGGVTVNGTTVYYPSSTINYGAGTVDMTQNASFVCLPDQFGNYAWRLAGYS